MTRSGSVTSNSPEHVTPSPLYPLRQVHWNDPITFSHTAFTLQLSKPSSHSSISAQSNCVMIVSVSVSVYAWRVAIPWQVPGMLEPTKPSRHMHLKPSSSIKHFALRPQSPSHPLPSVGEHQVREWDCPSQKLADAFWLMLTKWLKCTAFRKQSKVLFQVWGGVESVTTQLSHPLSPYGAYWRSEAPAWHPHTSGSQELTQHQLCDILRLLNCSIWRGYSSALAVHLRGISSSIHTVPVALCVSIGHLSHSGKHVYCVFAPHRCQRLTDLLCWTATLAVTATELLQQRKQPWLGTSED